MAERYNTFKMKTLIFMFIIIRTCAQISGEKLLLKLLQHVSVLIHHLQGVYSCVSYSYELLK